MNTFNKLPSFSENLTEPVKEPVNNTKKIMTDVHHDDTKVSEIAPFIEKNYPRPHDMFSLKRLYFVMFFTHILVF